MSINKYQSQNQTKNESGSRPEADQKQTRSRPEADQKRKWKQTRSKMTGIGILYQPKYDYQITIVNCSNDYRLQKMYQQKDKIDRDEFKLKNHKNIC